MSAEAKEGVPPDSPPPIRIRIESLSDLVFGLALSIGSIILVGRAPQNGGDIGVNVLLFGFGFGILVATWFGYSRTMSVLTIEVPYALLANFFLLFVVAIEPYLFYVLETPGLPPGLADAASVAYALDVGGMFLLQGSLAYLVVREDRVRVHGQLPLHPYTLARFRRIAYSDLVIGLVFAASALPIFWVVTPIGYLRFYFWSASAFMFIPIFARRRREMKMARQKAAARGVASN